MRAISSILMIAMLTLCIVRVQGQCVDEIYGTTQEGETGYAACEDIFDGFRSALCSGGQYEESDTTHCVLRGTTVFSYGINTINSLVGDVISLSLITDNANLQSFTVSPDLPSGLEFDTSNGKITGLTNAATPTATYTVTAGDQSTEITITVSTVICPAMDSFPETVDGQTASSTTACPEGMTGTATRVCNNGHFGDINISACTPLTPAGLNYSPYSINVKVGEAVFAKPSYTNTVTSFSISPSLPTGLTFDQTTGAIRGSSAVAVVNSYHTITATNASGSTTASITINISNASCTGLKSDNNQDITTTSGSMLSHVCPEGQTGAATRMCTNGVYSSLVDYTSCDYTRPTGFNYSPNTFILNVGEELNSGRPFFNGVATYFTITPPLPEGFVLDATTGVISGSYSVTTMYSGTVKAKPKEGSNMEASTMITIQVITPSCAETEDFHAVAVGSSAKFTCLDGYEGVMVRKCVASGSGAKWGLADVHCQAEQDYTFVIIGGGIFVVCLIILLIGCCVKSSRTRSKNTKNLPKSVPKAAPKVASIDLVKNTYLYNKYSNN